MGSVVRGYADVPSLATTGFVRRRLAFSSRSGKPPAARRRLRAPMTGLKVTPVPGVPDMWFAICPNDNRCEGEMTEGTARP
jgi:hypothetical protein